MAGSRAAEGVEHLQAAAKELVAAARSFLDVLDDVIDDPERFRSGADSVSTFVDDLTNAFHRRPGSDESSPPLEAIELDD